ncbi:MAG: excisionase family DNA-binding protein [Planctomycetota bacterium]|nr:excisionase family DNA-binding protein [Planctomycetota bacterium]
MTHDTSPRVSPVPRLALSMEETAQAIGLCGKTVGKLIADGRIRFVSVGTRRLVPLTEIQRWLDREAASASDHEGGR